MSFDDQTLISEADAFLILRGWLEKKARLQITFAAAPPTLGLTVRLEATVVELDKELRLEHPESCSYGNLILPWQTVTTSHYTDLRDLTPSLPELERMRGRPTLMLVVNETTLVVLTEQTREA